MKICYFLMYFVFVSWYMWQISFFLNAPCLLSVFRSKHLKNLKPLRKPAKLVFMRVCGGQGDLERNVGEFSVNFGERSGNDIGFE